MKTLKLLDSVSATGAGEKQGGVSSRKTFQATGRTTAGAGAATVQVRGTNNGGKSWEVIGTITLTLSASAGTNDASDSFASEDRYAELQGNVTALSGTGATVDLVVAY